VGSRKTSGGGASSVTVEKSPLHSLTVPKRASSALFTESLPVNSKTSVVYDYGLTIVAIPNSFSTTARITKSASCTKSALSAGLILGKSFPPMATCLVSRRLLDSLPSQLRDWRRAERTFDALQPTGFVQKTTVPVVMGFFSEVFAANTDRVPNWQVLIAKQDEQTKTALNRALAMSKGGGALHSVDHSAGGNDLFWGAFFASGNPKFIKKLVDQLKYFDERDDFVLFGAGGR
jgi:hypothetical protein